MSMEYIRKFYDVPAKRGMAVRFMGNRTGKIVWSDGAYLRIKFSGCKIAKNYHPTYTLEYLDSSGAVIWPTMSVESALSVREYAYSRGREFFAKQILSEIDSGKTAQEVAKICLGEIRRYHRAGIDKGREEAGLPPADWSKVP